MYIEELIRLFDTAAGAFPVLGTDSAKEELRRAIEGRRYDLQDEALIEAILKQDTRDLVDSFTEAYASHLHGSKRDTAEAEHADGDASVKEAVRIYLASLEHMINYYHTSLIGKHFSST
jgi:hypothetical protein